VEKRLEKRMFTHPASFGGKKNGKSKVVDRRRRKRKKKAGNRVSN
jgi:hypothetical protein